MKILLDHSVTRKLRSHLKGHVVMSAESLGWKTLRNGELLKAAEVAGYELMITADQSIFYQQNNATRKIALLVLSTNDWTVLRDQLGIIREWAESMTERSYQFLWLDKR